MGTRVSHTLSYDAPLADVHAMLLDPAFREEVCARARVLSSSAAVEELDAGHRVTIEQVQSAAGLPSFATRIVGDSIRIVQVETWTTTEHADVEVTIPGKPGEMTGTATLSETAGVTTEQVELDIRVRIPLVAGKVEKLVADMLRKALDVENAVGREYLSRVS
ncbi:DUF2505 domain-containing protein [Nocardioides sp. zg-DK7169]|uniref:DUF2505 domain-containing protein n=1 Tax=Nocardioides sp. zg-DK7169 TaxID=2736600 RepID=UPI0015569783|nr:DUF2505 domain-containing protein [Nocardioides sp. zg-DK7169]NPC95876.1 DUF2505 domain-containing protein [Nocardioides sp. zg-DK7169]